MYTKDSEHYKNLEFQLQKAMTECGRLQEENERLNSLLGLPSKESTLCSQTLNSNKDIYSLIETDLITNVSSPDKKVAFFQSLFRGREDVYPVRWQGKNSKSGYSPQAL